MRRELFWIAGLDISVMTIGIIGTVGVKRFFGLLSREEAEFVAGVPGFWRGGHLSYLALAVAVVAIVTFFGVLIMDSRTRSKEATSDAAMRRAITVTVVTVYLMLVSTGGFFRSGNDLPQLAQTLISSFTATVGVVVAFFFGSSAYLEGRSNSVKTQSDERQI